MHTLVSPKCEVASTNLNINVMSYLLLKYVRTYYILLREASITCRYSDLILISKLILNNGKLIACCQTSGIQRTHCEAVKLHSSTKYRFICAPEPLQLLFQPGLAIYFEDYTLLLIESLDANFAFMPLLISCRQLTVTLGSTGL